MFPGTFSASVFLKTATYTIIGTLILIYQISQYYHHEKPFPDCWISGCAGHYPEFVFFRIATISGSLLVLLGWLTNHFYLRSIARENAFPLYQYYPQIPMICGMIGAMLLMGSTANIDTGKERGDWHSFCASTFFVFTLIAQIYNTTICTMIYLRIKVLSLANVVFKLILLVLIVLQVIWSSSVSTWEEYQNQIPNSKGQFFEWTITFTVILGFYSMALDCQNFKFVYQSVKTRDQELEQLE